MSSMNSRSLLLAVQVFLELGSGNGMTNSCFMYWPKQATTWSATTIFRSMQNQRSKRSRLLRRWYRARSFVPKQLVKFVSFYVRSAAEPWVGERELMTLETLAP